MQDSVVVPVISLTGLCLTTFSWLTLQMWSFDKIITHRERFKPIVARLNKLIGRDAFTDGLLQVGLLASVPTDEDEEPGTSSEPASPMEVDNEETSDEIIPPLPVKRVKLA